MCTRWILDRPVDSVYIKNMSKIFSGQTSVIEVNALHMLPFALCSVTFRQEYLYLIYKITATFYYSLANYHLLAVESKFVC